MRTRWIAAALTAAAALGGTRGDACGDKFLRVGRGARYQRGYVAIHPACILILADPQSGVGQALTELEPALKKAGHKPLLVRSQEAMDPALKTGHYNIVLADLNEVSAVMARVASAHAKAAVLTVVDKSALTPEVQRSNPRYVQAPGKKSDALEQIDDFMDALLKESGANKKP